MATPHLRRLLHAAPPDYGIVEMQDEVRGTRRFLIYRLGTEVGSCPTADQAWRFAETHKRQAPAAQLTPAAPVSGGGAGEQPSGQMELLGTRPD